MALALEGQVQRHTLVSEAADTSQATVGSRAEIWAIPIRFGPMLRTTVGESVRFSGGLRGAFTFLTGTTRSRGSAHSASTSVVGVGGLLGAEVRLGAGWWGLEGGYTWTSGVDMDQVVDGFSPGGVEILTRFRFVI